MPAVQHIALNCQDRLATENFYTRHFGFRRARVFNRGADNEFALLRLGSTCLELFTAGQSATGGEQTVGFKHLAFEVDDIDAAVAALRRDGIVPESVIDCARHLPGMRVCFFNDPDGNRLELMEGYRDE